MATQAEVKLKFDILESYRGNLAANAADAIGSSQQILFRDGFEGALWTSDTLTNTPNYTPGSWTTVAAGSVPRASPHGGAMFADFNSFFSGAGTQVRLMASQGFAIPADYGRVTLSFWMFHDPQYYDALDRVQIQVSAGGGAWTDVGPATLRRADTRGWTQTTVDLSAYSGQPSIKIAFLGISEYGNDIYIDDVTVSGLSLDSKILRAERLLFELRGDLLNSPTTGNPAESYFDQVVRMTAARPMDRFDCGTWLPNLAAPNTPNEAAIDAKLQLCDRFSLNSSVAETYASACIDALKDVKALSDANPAKAKFRTEYDTVLKSLFTQFLARLPVDSNGLAPMTQRVPILRSRLAAIQRWYDAVQGYNPASGTLYADTSRLLKALWDGNLKQPVDQVAISLDSDAYQTQAFSAQRQMLLAAFPDPNTEGTAQVPMTGPPLLSVVADAFRPLAIRLTELDRYHDLACTFRGGCAGAFAGELGQLHRLLGTLHDPAAFAAAEAAADTVSATLGDDWRAVFRGLHANHSALETATRTAFSPAKPSYDKADAETVWTNGPVFLTEFSSLVKDEKKKLDNFKKSGLFLGASHDSIAVGLSKQKQGEIESTISDLRTNLSNAITEYKNTRATLVRNLVDERAGTRTDEAARTRLALLAKSIENQSRDLAALRINAEVDAARLADFGRAFQDAAAKWKEDPAFAAHKIDIGSPIEARSVSGASAVFTGVRSTSITDYQLPGWKVQAANGDVLNIEVSGFWSPTCALNLSPMVNGMSVVVAPGARTGPQGFESSFSQDHYQTASHSTSNDDSYYASASESVKACLGASLTTGTPGEALTGSSAKLTATAEACISGDVGSRESTTTSDSSSNGLDIRNSAAFTYGMRSSKTPFPEYPVGSLLLVKMAPGKTSLVRGELLDVRVLQTINSIPVDLPRGTPSDALADFYLVPNELKSDACTVDTSNRLTISVSKLTNSGDAAKKFGAAMSEVANSLREAARARLEQGRVLPNDMQALREAASAQLAAACESACDPAIMPTAMTGFFNAWVASELARLEREVEIRQIERLTEAAMVELKGINTEVQSLGEEARLLGLLPGWTLQSLDADSLRSQTNDLMVGLVQWVHPMVRVRYPEVLTLLDQDPHTKSLLDTMQAVSWSTPVVDLAGLANDFALQVTSKLRIASVNSPTTGYVYPVVIAFPNPNFIQRPGIPVPVYPFKKADEARSRQVWGRIAKRTGTAAWASITIRPEDIIDALGGAGQLVCTKAAPVLSSMGIHVVRNNAADNGTLNNYSVPIPLRSSPLMSFLLPEGPLEVEATDQRWLEDQVRVTFGTYNDAINLFHAPGGPSSTPVLAGLSPVSTFEVNFAALVGTMPVDPFSDTTTQAILVVADVDPRSVAAPGTSWIETCH